jgi:hemerythrin-like domain-containing protein
VKLTEVLRDEHQEVYALLNELEDMTSYAGELKILENAMAILMAEVGLHATLEEKLLFPALRPHTGTTELFAELQADHQEFRHALEQIADAEDVKQALNAIPEILDMARRHFQKEDEVLYPLAEELLGDEILCQLGETWAAERTAKSK